MAWEACEGSKAAGVEQAAEVTLEGIGIGVGIVEVVLVATLCAVELYGNVWYYDSPTSKEKWSKSHCGRPKWYDRLQL